MAPNKIYVKEFNGEISQTWSRIKATVTTANAQHEYIRKDALLEWAKELKERWEEPPMAKHSPGCVYMLEQLINKLKSM